MNLRTSPSEKQKLGTLNYRQLFRDLPGALLLLDASAPDFPILDLNKTCEELAGVGRTDVIGRPVFDVFPDISSRFRKTGVSEPREHIEAVAKTGSPKQLETFRYDRKLPGGRTEARYWQANYQPVFDTEKRVQYILCTVLDVTEGVRVSRREKSLESKLQAALEIGRVGSWVWDVQADTIVGDKNLPTLLHLNKKERAAGTTIKRFLAAIHPDDRPRVEHAIRMCIIKRAPFEEEFRYIRKDGTQNWVLARGKAEDHDGGLVFSGVMVDTTERNDLRAQIELAHQQEELNRQTAKILQQRNEELIAIGRSKDEFVALASHQLRTPATAVKQYLGMVLQGYAGDITDVQTDMLEKAFESNERQIQLVNQILNAARVDTGRLIMSPVTIDLRTIVQAAWDEMKGVFEQHQHRYNLSLPAVPLWVEADQSYVRMAIENVLYNACIYTPDGGLITVRLQRVDGTCRLSITDTGVGIDKADIGKLFAKFSRIHNPLSVQAGGSGIGLYLTSEIVRLHQGKVDVTSKLHHGTTFAISFPLMHNKKQDELKSG